MQSPNLATISNYCLTDQLEFVGGYNDRVETARIEFNTFIQDHKGLPGYRNFEIKPEDLPEINIPKIQKALICRRLERKEPNLVLADAIIYNTPIRQTLEELSRVNKGIRRFFPKGKNKVQNKKVKQITELLGKKWVLVNNLRADGIFSFRNPAAYILPTTMAGTYTGLTMDKLKGSFPLQTIAMGGMGLLISSLYSVMYLGQSNRDLPWKKAEDLDAKLDELF